MSWPGSEAFLQRVRVVGYGDEVFVHFERKGGGEAGDAGLLAAELEADDGNGAEEGFVHLS